MGLHGLLNRQTAIKVVVQIHEEMGRGREASFRANWDGEQGLFQNARSLQQNNTPTVK
jgi:hypothetical protein